MTGGRKLGRNALLLLVSAAAAYALLLALYNSLTYGNFLRNWSLPASMADYYTKRWALPQSKLYFAREVVLTTGILVSVGFFVLMRLLMTLACFARMAKGTEDLRGSSRWADEQEVRDNGYCFDFRVLGAPGKSPAVIFGQGLDAKVSGRSMTEWRIRKNSRILYGAMLRKERGKPPEVNHSLVFGTTGCHGKGTPILMADGSIKKIEDIVVGDKVMGDDGTERNVLHLYHGTDKMYKLIPKKSKPVICNGEHKLRLVFSPNKENDLKQGELGKKVRYGRWDEYVEITISDYLQKSKNFKHLYKLYYGKADSFAGGKPAAELKIPPYVLGALLGDGSISSYEGSGAKCRITCKDEVVLEEFESWIASLGGSCRKEKSGGGCPRYIATMGRLNWQRNERKWLTSLKHYNLLGCVSDTKFIPFEYKTAERQVRLEILAGIIDTDGCLCSNCHKSYEIITKSERLANDISFIARSLGFSTSNRKCKKSSQTGFAAFYHRITISGGVSEIPCRVERKQCQRTNTENKRNNVCGFDIEYIGEGEFFGMQVDSNNLYMNDDFLVLRNSGKGVGTIVPTLLTHTGSLICYDPAGENFRKTAGWRGTFGDVLVFNPQDLRSTLRLNPLDWIRRDGNFVQTDIENLAGIIVSSDPSSKQDPFWDNMARLVFSIYAGYVLLIRNPAEQNLYTMTRLPSVVSGDDGQEEDAGDPDAEERSFLGMLGRMEDSIRSACFKEEWRKLLATVTLDKIMSFRQGADSEKTTGSIIQVFNSHMAFYANPNTAALMDRTTFSPDDFMYRERPLSVYIIIGADDQERCKTFVRVLCEVVLIRLERDDARYERDGRHVLLFLLDEFPLLGHMGTIAKAIPVTRKYGVAFCLITQDLAQLEMAYTPKGAISILNNMHVICVKKVNDIETAGWVSRMMGRQTIEIERTSFSKQTDSLRSNSSSTSSSSEGRDLLDASEVRRLKNWNQIMFIPGAQPVLSTKVQWFRTKQLEGRAGIPIGQAAREDGGQAAGEEPAAAIEAETTELADEADLAFEAPLGDEAGEAAEAAKESNAGMTDHLERREAVDPQGPESAPDDSPAAEDTDMGPSGRPDGGKYVVY